MRKALRTPKGYAGCVLRDLRRHLHLPGIPEGPLRERICHRLVLTSRMRNQPAKGGAKVCDLHEPAVDRIFKGKAPVRCEFGCKVSVATTVHGGFVVGMRAKPGNS